MLEFEIRNSAHMSHNSMDSTDGGVVSQQLSGDIIDLIIACTWVTRSVTLVVSDITNHGGLD